jgi:Protein of unknown function (DUF4019)
MEPASALILRGLSLTNRLKSWGGRILILGSLLSLLCSCNAAKRKDLAEGAVREFRVQLDSEQYHAIYMAADDDLRRSTEEKDFAALMAVIHQKLGKVQESHLRYYVDGQSTSRAGRLLTLVYDTTFASGPATERFLWHVRNQRAMLLTYDVKSDALTRN